MEKTAIHTQKMEVLAEAYNQHAADLLRYFQTYTHNKMEAEDMTHDLFLKLMRVDVLNKETVQSLLFITASRMMVDDARHKSCARKYEREAVASMRTWEQPSALRHLEGEHLRQQEMRCMSMMCEKRAKVYQMYFHEEKCPKEISQTLNMNIRTVEGHVYLSRKQMRMYLQKACNE